MASEEMGTQSSNHRKRNGILPTAWPGLEQILPQSSRKEPAGKHLDSGLVRSDIESPAELKQTSDWP
jgi:hypothetical protein